MTLRASVLSVIIPSYKDPLLCKTIQSVLDNAVGDVEVIPVLDGYETDDIPSDPRVFIVKSPTNLGMRGAINAGLAIAEGEFVMKLDSHCLLAPDFDKELTESCAKNWLMIPRRYSLEDTLWQRNEGRPIRDYHYFEYPAENGCGLFVHAWGKKGGTEIDDTMAFQGSCWLANRRYFMEHVGMLDDRLETYGTFIGDQAEIGLKYWLNDGEIKVNKRTWYAHLQKTKRHYISKMYSKSYKTNRLSPKQWAYTARHWMNNEEPGMKKPLSWLIEKFSPVPSWPENWGK